MSDKKKSENTAQEFHQKLSTPIMKLAGTISGELFKAMVYYEVFVPSGLNEGLIGRVNNAAIAPGFNVASEALQLSCILALCRLWDKQKKAAHLPAIAKQLKSKPQLASDQEALKQWLSDVEAAGKLEELKTLLEYRNVGLAHTSNPNQPDPRSSRDARRVVYGDERKVLEVTIDLVDRLNLLIDYPHAPISGLRKDWQLYGASFWDQLAPGIAGS